MRIWMDKLSVFVCDIRDVLVLSQLPVALPRNERHIHRRIRIAWQGNFVNGVVRQEALGEDQRQMRLVKADGHKKRAGVLPGCAIR